MEISKNNERAIARLLTKIENNKKDAIAALKKFSTRPKYSKIVGVTGPLGVGKSTLVYCIASYLVEKGHSIAILLNDPASVKGGAFLGDRIRMQRLCGDVFIRSLSSRESGGISRKTRDIIKVLNAAEYNYIIIESTGVGQSETQIADISDICIVVLMPNLGDEIQSMKSGLMEIGDMFVINKADQEGADRTIREIESMLHIKGKSIPVLKTIATKNKGISKLGSLLETISVKKSDNERLKHELESLLKYELIQKVFEQEKVQKKIEKKVKEIMQNKTDTYSAVESILGMILNE